MKLIVDLDDATTQDQLREILAVLATFRPQVRGAVLQSAADEELQRIMDAADRGRPASVTCPRCGRISYHPDDVASGYCGHCHDWTSREPAHG